LPDVQVAPSRRRSAKAETLVQCAECGKGTSVPFKPTQNRPVYCADCFLKQKQDQKTA
jgi:CxxC-x17-CxxC domain-containing protein